MKKLVTSNETRLHNDDTGRCIVTIHQTTSTLHLLPNRLCPSATAIFDCSRWISHIHLVPVLSQQVGIMYYRFSTPLVLSFIAVIFVGEAVGGTAIVDRKNSPNRKKNFLQTKQFQQKQSRQKDDTGDRRVIPWVSIAVLLNFLFFFRSFAAPFFDPLVSLSLFFH